MNDATLAAVVVLLSIGVVLALVGLIAVVGQMRMWRIRRQFRKGRF